MYRSSLVVPPQLSNVTIKKVALPPSHPEVVGQAKPAVSFSALKPGNKNLEMMAIGNVMASFAPVPKRRKILEDTIAPEQQKPQIEENPIEDVPQNKPAKIVAKRNSQNPAAPSFAASKGAKKAKKEFAVQNSNLQFKDIGGLDRVLKELCELLLHIKHPDVYRHIGLPPPRGFLLHGPPGCGKTLLAQAIAGVSEF